MTQEDLKDYLLLPEYQCQVYKVRLVADEGTYYTIKNMTTKEKAILFPIFKKKDKSYTPLCVCRICNTLDVPVPDYGKAAQDVINSIISKSQEE